MPIINVYLDVEERIEREIERAAAAARGSDKCLWIAGFYAVRIVGKYQINATADIALKAGRSTSTVENWAHAVMMVRDLRAAGYSRDVARLRRIFSPTHFWTLWELQRKYSLSPSRCLHYLSVLLQHRENGHAHGAGALEREVDAGEKRNGRAPGFVYYLPRFQNYLTGLLAAVDTPDDVRAWLMAAPVTVKEYKR